MKAAIYTGTIVLSQKEYDVRKIYVIERLKFLIKYDLDLYLVTPKTKLTESEKKLYKSLSLLTYNIINKKHFKYISTLVFSIPKLIRLDCDLIHCYSHQAAFIAILIQKIRLKKTPILFEPMGLSGEESRIISRSSNIAKLYGPLNLLIEKFIFKNSLGIITYTEAMKCYISKQYTIDLKDIFVVPLGINKDLFIGEYGKDINLIKKFGLEGKKIIMYAGSISELHGTFDLVKSIQIINISFNNAVLLILGGGALKTKIQEFIIKNNIDNIKLIGLIPQKELPNYYAIADILVIPHVRRIDSELDFPTKLFEYLCSGKPIVSTNLRPIANIVGENAILVNSDDPKSLAEGILKLLNNEKLAQELGEKGREIVKSYSWEESSRQQYETYKNFVKNNN